MEEIITKVLNKATIVEIITKEISKATMKEIITKESTRALWRKCKQWNNRTIEQMKKP